MSKIKSFGVAEIIFSRERLTQPNQCQIEAQRILGWVSNSLTQSKTLLLLGSAARGLSLRLSKPTHLQTPDPQIGAIPLAHFQGKIFRSNPNTIGLDRQECTNDIGTIFLAKCSIVLKS